MQQKKLRISVVIPAYNEEKLIRKCLDALLTQTRPVDEIIVVNNNSTDNTATIAKTYDGVTVIDEKRQGITYARSAGFDHAHGDVIARIDVDSIAAPTWAAAIEKSFLSDPAVDGVAGDAAVAEISPSGKFWGQWTYRLARRYHQRSMQILPLMFGFNSAIRKSAWDAIKSELTEDGTKIQEDLEITICLLKSGRIIKHAPDMIVKCYALRMVDFKKLNVYRQRDDMTMAKHQFGNPKRYNK